MTSANPPDLDAATIRRIGEAFERRTRDPDRRERAANRLFSGSFLLAAGALALLAPAEREWDPVLAVALVVGYAVAAQVEFSVGAGYGVPTQLLLVPMLLLLPTPWVPLLVAAAYALSAVVKSVRGPVALRRAWLATADAWYSLAPALVLVLAGAQEPAWRHWPVYLAALAAQLLLDAAVAVGRANLSFGLRVRDMVPEVGLVQRVDALLAPIGLLAAMAARPHPATALLVLPPVGLLALLSREREGRIERTLELGRAYRGTALLLHTLLEKDDEYTGRHTQDVVELALRVADALDVEEEVRQAAELGALLHDIGKIAIPDHILNKPGALDADEWALMRTHTVEGQRMLDQVGGLLASVGTVVRASHERWDGGGYPDGLAGDAIPLAARIISACDAFNAMTTDRPYRPALSRAEAVVELQASAGTQLDPRVVRALLSVVWRPGLSRPPAAR